MRAEFYVSGYASADEESIHRYLFDTEKRTIRETASVTGIESPSYMAVHPNGGNNSIAVYSVNNDGTLNAPVFSPSGGDGPRDISLIGDHSTGEYVISANQNSGDVVIYRLEDDNSLTDTGIHVMAGSPTCVVPAVL